jgi:hypothetical protein
MLRGGMFGVDFHFIDSDLERLRHLADRIRERK